MATKFYSLLEQHTNGAWWYHRLTFKSIKEAEEYNNGWIWWDKARPRKILEHKMPLPDLTLYTFDFREFYKQGGSLCVILVK